MRPGRYSITAISAEGAMLRDEFRADDDDAMPRLRSYNLRRTPIPRRDYLINIDDCKLR